MKALSLIVLFSYFFAVTVVGIPVHMNLAGLSRTENGLFYVSGHESIIKLLAASELELHCQDERAKVCVRPRDFSQLKTNLPIELEACQSGKSFPRCDDLVVQLDFSSRDILKIGLRL